MSNSCETTSRPTLNNLAHGIARTSVVPSSHCDASCGVCGGVQIPHDVSLERRGVDLDRRHTRPRLSVSFVEKTTGRLKGRQGSGILSPACNYGVILNDATSCGALASIATNFSSLWGLVALHATVVLEWLKGSKFRMTSGMS